MAKAENRHRHMLYNRLLSLFIMLLVLNCMKLEVNADVGRRYDRFNQEGYVITGDGATDMVAIATKQIGKTSSYFNYTGSWCAAFVVDCAEIAKQSYSIPFVSGSTHGVAGLRQYVLDRGGSIVALPQAGDLVFYYDTVYSKWCHVGVMTGRYSSVQGNLGGES